MKIDLIDIGFGNIRSLKNWLESCNIQSQSVSSIANLKSEIIILPGVGSAGPYMTKLIELGFDKAIKDHVKNNGRLIGICLGFHILFNNSEEDNGTKCLGLLDGEVIKINEVESHNGWKNFYFRKEMVEKKLIGSQNLTTRRIVDGRVFYNHEYGVINKEKNTLDLKIPDTLKKYSSFIVKNRIIGIQFHPEKSQLTGKELLEVLV